ncbi:unnamed protein product [Closterium sp. NIES-64]|nr:unnamed protein product [Closterium sp. NIES-64]
MMFSRISLLRFPLRSVACAGCAPTGDPSPPPPRTVPPLTCHSPFLPSQRPHLPVLLVCTACGRQGRGGQHHCLSTLSLPITHATRSSFPPLFSPCRSLGLKEQWQADVGQQASTWVALMPEAPGGSRQHAPSPLPYPPPHFPPNPPSPPFHPAALEPSYSGRDTPAARAPSTATSSLASS